MGGINGWMAEPSQPPHPHSIQTPNCIMDWRFDSKDPKGMQSIGIKCLEVWGERIRGSPRAPGPGVETRRNVLLAASWPLTLTPRPKYLHHLLLRVLMGQGRQPSEAGGGPEALKPSQAVTSLIPPGPYISHMALMIHYGMRKLRQGQILQGIRCGVWLPFSRQGRSKGSLREVPWRSRG